MEPETPDRNWSSRLYRETNMGKPKIAEEKPCKICGKVGLRQSDRCSRCSSKNQRERDKKVIDYIVGDFKCWICGYDKCKQALDFHHVNPDEKLFGVSREFHRNMEDFVTEIKKCVLVCCRCHREIHAAVIPSEVVKGIHSEEWGKRNFDANHLREIFNIRTRPDLMNRRKEDRLKRKELLEAEKQKRKSMRRCARPSIEVLQELVFKFPTTHIGKMFGVTDNAVKKWYRYYKLDYPKRGYWAKLRAGKIDQ